METPAAAAMATSSWWEQHVAAVAAAAAVAMAVRLLPLPSLAATREGGDSFLFSMTARVCGGGPFSYMEPKMGREGKGPT